MTALTAYIIPTVQEQWQLQQLIYSPPCRNNDSFSSFASLCDWNLIPPPCMNNDSFNSLYDSNLIPQWQLQQRWQLICSPSCRNNDSFNSFDELLQIGRDKEVDMVLLGGEASWQLYLRSCTSGLNVVFVHGFFLFIQLAAPPVPLAQQGCHAEVLSYSQQARARQPTCSGKNRFFISDQPSCPQSSFVISITWWLST